MKKVIIGIVTVLAMTACGPSGKEAVDYNNTILALENQLDPIHQKFIDQLDGHNIDSLKIAYVNFVSAAKAALENSQKIEAFHDHKNFAEATVAYFKTISDLSQSEGKQIVDIMSKDSASVTEADVAKVGELTSKFDTEYNASYKKLQDAQVEFAKTFKFDLEEK